MVPARTLNAAAAAWLAAVALAACDGGKQVASPASAGAARSVYEEAASPDFIAQQHAWRRTRVEALKAPDGYLTLLTRTWIKDGTHRIGTAADNDIRIAYGPAHLARVTRTGQRVVLEAAEGAALSVDGQRVRAPVAMHAPSATVAANRVEFDEGQGSIALVGWNGEIGVRVRHAKAPTRTGFTAIDYYPPHPRWRVSARFMAHPPGTTVPIVNALGQTMEMPNPGALEFQLDGKSYRLDALDDGEPGQLFIVFGDRSNGRGTYGGGRFIQTAKADAQGRVVLDFNQAFNPPCVFTPYATCPLPPPQNRLPIAVEAGEKRYAAPSP